MDISPQTVPSAPPLPPIDLSHPLVQQLASGQAEERIRQAGAKGVLPLDRANLARSFYILSRDPDKDIRLLLKQTIDTYDEDLLSGMASDESIEPPVLHFLAAACPNRPRVIEEVVLNAQTSIETASFLAKRADGDMLELISINEERLILAPTLVDVMLENPKLTPRVRLRLREIQVRHFGMRTEDKDLAHLQVQAQEQEKKEIEQAVAAPPPPEAQAVIAEIKSQLKTVAAPEEDDKEELTLYMRVKNMNTGQKIRAAMTEGRGARMLLVRDTSKAVQRAVIDCPKITLSEVELIAQMRNVNIEMLERIGNKKAFRKNLAIAQALIKNPRTPQRIALELLPNISLKDLDIIQKDRNVSEVVRKQAKFAAMRKQNPEGEKKVKFKKK